MRISHRERRELRKKRVKRGVIAIAIVAFVFICGFILSTTVFANYFATPKIELLGNAEEHIDVFSEYVEPGFEASVQGGKPTNEVVVDGVVDTQKLGEYKITYSLKNNKGFRERKKERIVIVEDNLPPEIVLNRPAEIFLLKGLKYNEGGATVTDNVDGDISSSIEIIGEVNSDVVGDYEILYRVSDSSGNQVEATRKVSVTATPTGSTVYLTFDDGPSKLTAQVLDVLKAYDAKATFFVVGSSLDKYADVIKRAVSEGHTIALHSNSHEYEKIYKNDEAFWKDMDTLSNRVKEITGKESKLIRFPGGSSNTISKNYSKGIMKRLVGQAHDKGYRIYDWSISSGDAAAKTVDTAKIVKNVTKGMKKNLVPAIVLMHDAQAKTTTVEATKEILQWGLDNGYSFAAMDENTPEEIHGINN